MKVLGKTILFDFYDYMSPEGHSMVYVNGEWWRMCRTSSDILRKLPEIGNPLQGLYCLRCYRLNASRRQGKI